VFVGVTEIDTETVGVCVGVFVQVAVTVGVGDAVLVTVGVGVGNLTSGFNFDKSFHPVLKFSSVSFTYVYDPVSILFSISISCNVRITNGPENGLNIISSHVFGFDPE
jgi:hypothetical protein